MQQKLQAFCDHRDSKRFLLVNFLVFCFYLATYASTSLYELRRAGSRFDADWYSKGMKKLQLYGFGYSTSQNCFEELRLTLHLLSCVSRSCSASKSQ